MYGNLIKKFIKKRRKKIFPNFLQQTRFFFQFDGYFEKYRNKSI